MQEDSKKVELEPIYADKRTTTDQGKKVAQVNSKGKDDGFSLSTALTGALVALLIALPVTYKYIEHKLEALGTTQPQIAVIDFSAILAAQAERGAGEDEISETVLQLNEVVTDLTSSGFIVLDGNSVLSAPENVYISSELLRDLFEMSE